MLNLLFLTFAYLPLTYSPPVQLRSPVHAATFGLPRFWYFKLN